MPDSPLDPVLCWFRNDLRLTDNPALHAAVETGRPIIALYVLDEVSPGVRPLGGASKWWLDKSLRSLAKDIEALGGALTIRRGPAVDVITELVSQHQVSAVFWNRRYMAHERRIDSEIKDRLRAHSIDASSFNGALLSEPWRFQTKTGGYYRVFSPYWRAVQADYCAPDALPAPKAITGPACASLQIDDLGLHPVRPDWSEGLAEAWTPGEAGAHARLDDFLARGAISQYGEDRNRPDKPGGTSRLSPHLRWGEIGPAQIWRAVTAQIASGTADEKNAMTFLSEVAWREFSYVLAYHNDDLHIANYNAQFDRMPWRDDPDAYKRWCAGRTGFPIVDAGMRELWRTGWMHNRVRMNVASFLTKHLLIDWRQGEDWFWDTLVDADPAVNAASWQWVAGCGADAAPYFRIFNPITQGAKFDASGEYTRKWVPEIAKLSNKHLHFPANASPLELRAAQIELGKTYEQPMIEHTEGRTRALAVYNEMRKESESS